jgi:hypothetical protein
MEKLRAPNEISLLKLPVFVGSEKGGYGLALAGAVPTAVSSAALH